jgi:tryptophanyl-tRNA synthetase
VMNLQDPTAKMDKSAPPQAPGVIRLLDPPDAVRRKIARAVTDSGHRLEPGTAAGPGVANLLTILAACTGTTPDEAAAGADTYRELKESCADAVIALLTPLQDRYAALAADPQAVPRVLREGAERARSLAAGPLARAKTAIGLLPI